MPREKDPFWIHVRVLQNGKWKCNYCRKEYKGGVTRIKHHLAQVGGKGIDACKKVNRQVRSEAEKAVKGEGEAESSNGSEGNIEEGAHLPVSANNEDAPRETSFPSMPHRSFDGASSSANLPFPGMNLSNQFLPAQATMDYPFPTQSTQHHAGDSYIQPQNMSDPSSSRDLAPEALANMPGPVNTEEGEPNTEVPQDARTDYALMDSRPSTCGPVDKNMPTRKRKLEEVSNREADMDGLETWCRKSLPLLTTELVGVESEEAIEEICEYLMEDEIFILGIYGMGGVGKTAILMHVHNKVLLENPAISNVFWVSVPQKFSVYELQDEIANVVGLDSLSKVKDVKRRASILHRHLEKMESPILLNLDGLWMHFEVKDVGIPIKKGGLRLVLTTRSLDVCHKMLCQKQIRIRPLCEQNDSWNLFLEKLGPVKELPSEEVKDIARSILRKCGGLPLGIIEMATHMRGVEKVHEWKDLLQKLEDSRMELDVLKELKLSYINLVSPQVQRCFLHLVLCFGEALSEVTKEEVIESLIDEGLLGGIATRQNQHDQGNTILDKIRKSCLWDDPEEEEDEKSSIHPLIRDMALQIVTSTTHMVKARMGLKEIPQEEFWTNRLEKVFLQSNSIKEIPHGISPNCPKLTRLSLNENVSLEAIYESFFRHLNGLKVLDLSNTRIMKLPDPVTQLESLEALLLRGCGKLRRIPRVGKLGSLRKLDLNGCAMIEEMPEGMERLVKLTYLDLQGTKIGTFPDGLLGKLVSLQYLAIRKARAGEEATLKVGHLECSVSNVETFNSFARFIERNSSGEHKLGLNASEEDFFTDDNEDYFWYDDGKWIIIESCHKIAAWEDGGIAGDGCALLPKNVKVLRVGGCDGVTRLCEVGALEDLVELTIKEWENLEGVGAVHFPRLKRLNITGCPKLKHLWEEGQLFPRPTTLLPNLEGIEISSCEKLEEIIRGPLPSGVTCGRLTSLEVKGCNNMKGALLTQDMLLHLPSLQHISVKNCEGIEEIIGGGPLPIGATCGRLTYLYVRECNNMKGALLTQNMLLHLPSLQHISVSNCEGIEEIIGGGPMPIGATCGRLTYLYVYGCNNMKGVLLTQNMLLHLPSLESITVSNCEGIEEIIGGGPLPLGATCGLKYLTVNGCNNMKGVLLTQDTLLHLSSLQQISVSNCEGIEEIIGGGPVPIGATCLLRILRIEGCNNMKGLLLTQDMLLHLPSLREISVSNCEGIEEIIGGGPLPSGVTCLLTKLRIEGCNNMKGLLLTQDMLLHLPSLQHISVRNCEGLEEIIGGGQLPSGVTFGRLTFLEVNGCNNMKRVLLTQDMSLCLPSLQEITIEDCKGIEVIIGAVANTTHASFPKLTLLTLRNLPELKSICDGNGIVSCDSLKYLNILKCPKLKRILVQLRILDNDEGKGVLPSPPPSLQNIRIDNRQTWESLERDHPLTSSLQRFVQFYS